MENKYVPSLIAVFLLIIIFLSGCVQPPPTLKCPNLTGVENYAGYNQDSGYFAIR